MSEGMDVAFDLRVTLTDDGNAVANGYWKNEDSLREEIMEARKRLRARARFLDRWLKARIEQQALKEMEGRDD